MARAYHAKKLSTKLFEGAIAGLMGGAVAAAILMLIDAFTRTGNAFWHTINAFAMLIPGASTSDAVSTNAFGADFFLGLVLVLLFFILVGIGLTYYVPIVRHFGWSVILLGVVYGVIIWLLVPFFLFSFFNPAVGEKVSNLSLFIASVVGCGVTGWWLDVLHTRSQRNTQYY
jgi:hypothetical protein